MITILSSVNKDAILIPSKLYSADITISGEWILRIDSLKVNDIDLFNHDEEYSEKELAILKQVNKDFLINGRHLLLFDSDNAVSVNSVFGVVIGTGQEAIFGIHSESNENIEINYSFYKEGELLAKGTIYNRKNISAKKINYDKIGTALENRKSSFAVLRTNPKFTGNIKLVVDSSNNMFLDTFKVSNKLTSVQYRHAKVSGQGSLSNDVRNVFSTLPKGELYRIAPDNLDAHKIYNDYNKQYDTTYHYGARTNEDQLYTENFSILAPLWINQILPDFFAIFRIDEAYNAESYTEKINDTEVFNKFLKEGKLIKLFDLRKSSPIGVYLNNHYNEISQYPGSAYLQFVEQEQQDESISWQGKNSWIGISVDKGIVVKKTETSYFANKILQETEGTQEKFNAFLIDGFERNNLVSANLINLEFMFNDDEAEPYKMHRYFGLYLKENDFLTYQFIDKKYDNNTQSEQILKYDSSLNIINDSFLLDKTEGIINKEEYKNRLVFAISPNEGIRMKSETDLTYFLKNTIANRPYENIGIYPVEKFESNYKEFITLNFNESLESGEHLRISVPSFRNPNTDKINSLIFEIVLSNDKRLATTDGVFPYIVHNKMGLLTDDNHVWYRDQIVRKYPDTSGIPYYEGTISQNMKDFPYFNIVWYDSSTSLSQTRLPKDIIDYPNVFRLAVYTQDFNDNTQLASVKEQIRRIAKAIDKFGAEFKSISYNRTSLSIGSNFTDTHFQRITSNIFEANKKTNDISKRLSYFGNYKLEYPTSKLTFDTLRYSSNDFLFAPIDFELFGDRETTIVKFAKSSNWYEVEVLDIDKVLPISLYKAVDGTFKTFNSFDVKTLSIDSSFDLLITSKPNEVQKVNIIQSPNDLSKYVVCVPANIWIENNKVNVYSSYPCYISLMGMLPVKDFESYINFQKSERVFSNVKMAANAGDVISIGEKSKVYLERLKLYKLESGKFENINLSAGNNFYIIDSSIYYGNNPLKEESLDEYITVESDCVISVVHNHQLEYDFNIKNPVLSEIYYYKDINDPSGNLKYPLLTPTITNWESIGTYYDADNTLNVNNLSAEYNKDLKKTSGFLSITKSYIGNLYHNQYVKSNLEYYLEKPDGKLQSFKDYLLDVSSLSNTINTYLTDEISPIYSIGYYNKYVNTLEFIIYGLKFMLSFNNANFNSYLRLSEYNNYTIFLLNDYSGAKNEILINSRERVILIINHQFDFGTFKKMDSILSDEGTSLNYVDKYNYIKSPFSLNFSEAFGNPNHVRVPLENPYRGKIDSSIFYQLDKFEQPNNYLEGDNLVGYFGNYIVNNVTSDSVVLKQGSGFVNNYNRSDNTLEYGIIDPSLANADYMKRYAYLIDPSIHISTNSQKSEYENFIDDYISTFSNNFKIYIKNNQQVVEIDQTESYQPLIMKVTRPKNIKYNYGYFSPKFVDMLEFDLDETDLVERTKTDYNSCNTSFRSIDSVKNLYASKVYNEINNLSLKKNYFVVPEFSLVCSDWDKNFYRMYTSENDYVEVNGVVPGTEDTTFFGSKCIKVKDDKNVIITDWSYNDCLKVVNNSVDEYSTTQKSVSYNSKEVSFNLTLALYNYFINNAQFRSNWKSFQFDNTYIRNYIKNCLQKYFKIDQKRNFKLYIKASSNQSEILLKAPENLEGYSEYKNFKSSYIEDNEDIICKVIIDDWNNKTYFAELNLNNKED